MRILTTISDVRKYRQLGKQVNQDNFNGIVREVQENELTELLNEPLSYDFFNYLENNWTEQAGTFTRDSDYQFTAANLDLSGWTDYALRINDEVFVIVKTAVFGGTDTIIVVEGYILPETLTTIEYKAENNYVKLLNGTTYTVNNNTIKYNGLRPYISWKFLTVYLSEGSVKQSDTGNFTLMPDNTRRPNAGDLNSAKSIRLQNSLREYNRITNYLNENSTIFPLWEAKGDENITNLEMIII
jgi:hypothetical protein